MFQACQKVVIDPNTVHYYDIGTQESVSYEYIDGAAVGYADGDLLAFNFVSADKGRFVLSFHRNVAGANDSTNN